jgi:superfamily II DNA or RNA helicase
MNLKDYKQLCKVKGYDIREHQEEFLTNNAFDNSRKPFVLGAGTSSGKGPMSIMWLELFYQNQANKNKTTLFVSASKTILRDNIHGVLKNFKPSFSYSIVKDKKTLIAALERNAQVLVLIPQTIKSYYKLLPKIHTFILDEAHEWYFAKTTAGKESSLSKIIKHTQPTKQLLLTGTPSKFIADGSKFNFQFVPVMDLYDAGLVSNVKMEIVSSTYDFKANDWQGTYGNLKSTKTNSPKQAEDALVSVCNEMINKLKNPLKEWYNINNVTKNSIGKLFDYMDKTIIYTHSLNQANKFGKILNSKKELSGKVLVSHSENDPDSIEFNKFKTESKYKVLIAVDRGRIGFDMPELFNIVDFTMTQNLDMLLQMYGRLLRKSDLQKKKQKIYFKVATKNTADYFVDLMTAMLCLTDMKWYSSYNGKNMGGIKIPKVLTKSIRNKQYTNNQSKKKSNKVKPYVSLCELGIPLDLNFFRQSILHSSNGKFNTIAETTLDDVRRECFDIRKGNTYWEYEEIKKAASKFKRIIDFIRFDKEHYNMYQFAYKKGWREIFNHCEMKNKEITKQDIIESANQYDDYTKWRTECNGLCSKAHKLGIVDLVTKHMKKRNIQWTKKMIIDESKKYTSKMEFKNNSAAYGAARRFNILDIVTKHMKRPLPGNSRKVIQKDLKGNVVKVFNTMSEAGLEFNSSGVQRVIYGKRPSYNGFIFEYEK